MMVGLIVAFTVAYLIGGPIGAIGLACIVGIVE